MNTISFRIGQYSILFCLFLSVKLSAQTIELNVPTYEMSRHFSKDPRPINELLTEVRILHLNNSTNLKGPIFVTDTGVNFLISDLGGHEVYIYNRRGDKLKDFRSINSGKEHFSFIGQIWKNEEEFCVYDPTSMTIFHYDLNGYLISRKRTRLSNATSLVGDSRFYYFDLNRIAPFGIPNTNHNIEVFDRRMKRVRSLVPYNYKMPINTGVNISNFSFYASSIYYHQPHSEEIYQLSSGKVSIEAKIDFGSLWAWRQVDSVAKISRYQFNELSSQKGLIVSFNSWLSDEFIFLQSYGNRTISSFLISRMTGAIQKIDLASIFESFTVNCWYMSQLQLTVSNDTIKEITSGSLKSEIEIKEMNKPNDNEFSIVWLAFSDQQ